MSILPRFRGRAFKIDEGWSFDFHMSILGDDDNGDVFCSNKVFKTKKEAIENLNIAIHDAIKFIAQKHPEFGIIPDNYIDMKTNKTRRWDKKDEH